MLQVGHPPAREGKKASQDLLVTCVRPQILVWRPKALILCSSLHFLNIVHVSKARVLLVGIGFLLSRTGKRTSGYSAASAKNVKLFAA